MQWNYILAWTAALYYFVYLSIFGLDILKYNSSFPDFNTDANYLFRKTALSKGN